jgi:hypothetical protein
MNSALLFFATSYVTAFVACVCTTIPFSVDAAPLVSSSPSACGVTVSTNVTAGVVIGPRKFTVSATDCCNFCTETPLCIGAVFSNYYCSMFSELTAVESSSTCTLLRVQTQAPPTTAAPTPTPTTPAPAPLGPPKGFALLTQCKVSTSCQRVMDPTCVTEVIPIDSCVSAEGLSSSPVATSVEVGSPRGVATMDGSKTPSFISVSALSGGGGVERHEFTTPDCSGHPLSSVLFPTTCTYEMNDYVSRMGVWVVSEPPVNQSVSYVVVGMQCSNAACTLPASCSDSFNGACDECLMPSSSSSSSGSSSSSSRSGGDGVVATVVYHCFTAQQMVAIFPFSTEEDCTRGQRVGGLALPTGQCYFDDDENHFYNLCNPA